MGIEAAKLPLTKKRIFTTKLRGDSIDILFDTMGKDMFLLIACGIFTDYVGQFYRFTVKYPIRIWYIEENEITKIDHLNIGDTWTIAR